MGNRSVFYNPVISGFHPDPSVCRNGDDYFLVVSSMEFFPGIPVYHSRDLVHWKQIGHVLNDPEIFDLKDCEASGGIMAPTIRFHEGVFYLTCGYEGKNFICTTTDPFRGWNSPVFLDGTCGIDNSLFFDDDGRCYYHENQKNPKGERFTGDRTIWMQELDLSTLQLIGEKRTIYEGDGGTYCEAPHVYKKDGWYYLICAEDGTYRNHSVVCARAKQVWGPYESCPRNPLLTSRHLSREYPIQNVGHLDLIETQNGEWWAFALGSRPYGGWDDSQEGEDCGGYFRNMGRETFLFPMKWERGWPVFCADTGRVEVSYPCPDLPIFSVETQEGCIHFREEDTLGLCWNFLRTPKEKWYMLDQENGLQLLARPERMDERVNPSFIGRRQEHMDFTVTAYLKFPMCTEYEEAGLVLFHNRFSYITFMLGRTKGRNRIRVIRSFYGKEMVEGNVFVEGNEGKLRISAVGQRVSFFYKEKGKMEIPVAEHVDSSKLNSDYTHSHTGNYIGMYVTSNGKKGRSKAIYEYFSYNGE